MKILHFIYGLHTGGAETFLENLMTVLPPDDYEFHFALQDSYISNRKIRGLIESRGYNLIHFIPTFTNHPFSQYHCLKDLIQRERFDFVHIHMNAIINPIPMIVCRRAGIRTILHSHNTNSNGGIIGRLLHHANRRIFVGNKLRFVACSALAGQWMFGSRPFTIVDNAVNLEKLSYNAEARDSLRSRYGISSNDIVLGSVGRLTLQKNHKQMIEIFCAFHKKFPKSRLMIVGDGPLRKDLEIQAKNTGLADYIIFCGNQSDPAPFYSAMDCFLMPSLFEGLGFTAIEAQASGLPIVVSTNLSEEVFQTDYIIRESLDASGEQWTEKIGQLLKHFDSDSRSQRSKQMKATRFDLAAQNKAYKALCC